MQTTLLVEKNRPELGLLLSSYCCPKMVAAHNDLYWLPKLGPELALSTSVASFISPVEYPSPSHYTTSQMRMIFQLHPQPLSYLSFIPHLP
jgi:hypothetical protein